MEKSAISLKKISKIYKKSHKNIEVFDNYSRDFEYWKMYGIIGHSGCGKTTLIKIIGMMEKTTSGCVLINKKDITFLTDKQKSKLRNDEIGFVFQNYLLDESLNIYENILLPTLINKDY